MEESLKNILFLINTKIDNFIKELKEKMNILKDIINTKINNIKNNKKSDNNHDIKQKKELFNISELEKRIKKILINDYKNDFILYAKKMIEVFEIIENNEPLNNNENPRYIFKNNNEDFPVLRMEQKYFINNFWARVNCLCSIKEKNNIYNKLCVGLNNGKINIYNLEKGNKLLEIKQAIKGNNEIIDICDLKGGLIGCTSRDYDIALYQLKEDILLNENNIFEIKCSFELIQKIQPNTQNQISSFNQIIKINPNNNNLFIKSDYISEYIVQSGWSKINIYIKKNNNRYYYYKEIKTPSRTNELIAFDKYNYFFALDYFSTTIYIFSSKTMELVTIIKDIESINSNLKHFGKLNDNILVFIDLFKIYLYNIIEFELIQEIELKQYYLGNNVIFSENNTILVSLIKKEDKEQIIMEYEFFDKEKKLMQKTEYNSEIINLNKNKLKNFFFSNNEKGKRYLIILYKRLIILHGDDTISILK